MAGRGFRQDVAFFVDGLPPTLAQTTRLFSHCSPTALDVEEDDLSRKGKVVAMTGIQD